MNARREQLRKEVVATIIAHMERSGLTGMYRHDDAVQAFPGVPYDLIWEASHLLEKEDEEAWWQDLERTIDGEVLRKAIGHEGGAS